MNLKQQVNPLCSLFLLVALLWSLFSLAEVITSNAIPSNMSSSEELNLEIIPPNISAGNETPRAERDPNGPTAKKKDIWDKAQIIGAILVPILVAIITALLVRILKDSADRNKLNMLIQLTSLLTSDDPRKLALVQEVLDIAKKGKSSKDESEWLEELFEPRIMAHRIHQFLEREGPAIRPFESRTHRICYGWISRFLVPVWFVKEDIWRTGLVHGQWIVLSSPTSSSGAFFIKGKGSAFSKEELIQVRNLPIFLFKLCDDFDELMSDTSESTDYGMVGYSVEEKGLALTAHHVSTSVFGPSTINTNSRFRKCLAGFPVVRPGSKSLIGLVSSQSHNAKILIIRWQIILDFIAEYNNP